MTGRCKSNPGWGWQHSGTPKGKYNEGRVCTTCRGTGQFSRRTSPNSSSHGLTEYAECSCCNGTGVHPADE